MEQSGRIFIGAIVTVALFLAGCQTQSETYRGKFPVYFTGVAINAVTGKSLEKFDVDISLYDKPLVHKTIHTSDFEYALSFDASTVNGQTCSKVGMGGLRTINALGPANESLTFFISAAGYQSKTLKISKDRVSIDQVNVLDIVLKPQSQPEK